MEQLTEVQAVAVSPSEDLAVPVEASAARARMKAAEEVPEVEAPSVLQGPAAVDLVARVQMRVAEVALAWAAQAPMMQSNKRLSRSF